jgi:hypothetical protein
MSPISRFYATGMSSMIRLGSTRSTCGAMLSPPGRAMASGMITESARHYRTQWTVPKSKTGNLASTQAILSQDDPFHFSRQ